MAQLKGAASLALAAGISVRTKFGQNRSSSTGTRSRELLNTKQECYPLDSDASNNGSCIAGHVTTKRDSCCNCTRRHGDWRADDTGNRRGA